MFWLQGFDQAPPLAHVCIRSWQKQNPDWTVNLLSEGNLHDVLDEDFCDNLLGSGLPVQKKANLIRLALLAKHGGVWADADCYCARPLDTWIDAATESGFFAYKMPDANELLFESRFPWLRIYRKTMNRIMGNWFLAGKPGNEICEIFLAEHFLLLLFGASHQRANGRRNIRRFFPVFRRNALLSMLLATRHAIKLFGAFHYFVFHQHFALLASTNKAFRKNWTRVPTFAIAPAVAYRFTLEAAVDETFLSDMAGNGAGVFKLNLRAHKTQETGTLTQYGWLLQSTVESGSQNS